MLASVECVDYIPVKVCASAGECRLLWSAAGPAGQLFLPPPDPGRQGRHPPAGRLHRRPRVIGPHRGGGGRPQG